VPLVEALLNSPNVGAAPIASYARPGGNVTGIIAVDVSHHARRLQLLKEVAPSVSRVIVLTPWDRPANLPGWPEIIEMARTLGIEVERVQPSGPDDIKPALEAAIERGADGLLQYQGNPFADLAVRQRVIEVLAEHRLPAVYIAEGWARSGGLLAYTPDLAANWKRAATYVDRILKGTEAGDLPIEQPTRFSFVVNLKTAQALGLAIPQPVLAQASELVQ
jgi:putative ABC transport system substrate-binding protein